MKKILADFQIYISVPFSKNTSAVILLNEKEKKPASLLFYIFCSNVTVRGFLH